MTMIKEPRVSDYYIYEQYIERISAQSPEPIEKLTNSEYKKLSILARARLILVLEKTTEWNNEQQAELVQSLKAGKEN